MAKGRRKTLQLSNGEIIVATISSKTLLLFIVDQAPSAFTAISAEGRRLCISNRLCCSAVLRYGFLGCGTVTMDSSRSPDVRAVVAAQLQRLRQGVVLFQETPEFLRIEARAQVLELRCERLRVAFCAFSDAARREFQLWHGRRWPVETERRGAAVLANQLLSTITQLAVQRKLTPHVIESLQRLTSEPALTVAAAEPIINALHRLPFVDVPARKEGLATAISTSVSDEAKALFRKIARKTHPDSSSIPLTGDRLRAWTDTCVAFEKGAISRLREIAASLDSPPCRGLRRLEDSKEAIRRFVSESKLAKQLDPHWLFRIPRNRAVISRKTRKLLQVSIGDEEKQYQRGLNRLWQLSR